jgi:hypothetical protein
MRVNRHRAFEGRNQAEVRKPDLGAVLRAVDLKDNVSAVPLGRVLHEVDVAVHDMPDDSLAWYPFGDPLRGLVYVSMTVCELCTELVRTTVNLS